MVGENLIRKQRQCRHPLQNLPNIYIAFSFLDSLCGIMDVLNGKTYLPQSVVLLWTAIRWNCRPCIPVHKGHLSFLLFCLPFCSSVKTHTERRAVFAARCIAD